MDLCLLLRKRLEGYGALIGGPACGLPRDALIRCLRRDLRIPFFLTSPDLGFPMKMLVIELMHFFDRLHEPRKLFKLCSLVIGGLYRYIHLDRCGDVHVFLP